jgi:hypothetical protein
MGLLLSLPLTGVLGTVGSSCLAGLAFCFTSTAGLYFFSLGHCSLLTSAISNYSLNVLQVLQLQLFYSNSHRICCTIPATMSRLNLSHIRWQMIFALNSMLAWLMKTRFMIELIEKWSYDYIKMDCEEGKCYGVLAVSVFSHGVSALASSQIGSPCLLRTRTVPCYSQYLTHRRARHPRQEGSHSKRVRLVIFSFRCLFTQS